MRNEWPYISTVIPFTVVYVGGKHRILLQTHNIIFGNFSTFPSHIPLTHLVSYFDTILCNSWLDREWYLCVKLSTNFSLLDRPSGPRRSHSWGCNITQWHTTFRTNPLTETGTRQRIQHTQEMHIFAPGGIRSHNRNKRAATDPLVVQRGLWDRLSTNYHCLFLQRP
jgi:hypothetical protein